MIKHILIVDDEECIRDSFKMLLIDKGYSVTIVIDGEEALNIMSEVKFDLIITDLHMPNRNGEDLIRIVRKALLHRGNPIIAMTGHPTKFDESYLKALGATTLLHKPINEVLLLKTIEEVL